MGMWTECVYLCIWNISLLLLTCSFSWVLKLITQVRNVLMVSLCKSVIQKLKILSGGNLNIISQWGNHKNGGNQILTFQWTEAKAGEHDFWLKFSGENLEGIFFEAVVIIMCDYFPKLKTHFFVVQVFRSHFGIFFCARLYILYLTSGELTEDDRKNWFGRQ